MVKSICLSLIFLTASFSEDVFERNCVDCHATLPATLQQMFKRYLLVYSGQSNMKAGIKHYLLYPSKDISVMSLEEAIDIYWDKYNILNKLE